MGQKAFHGWYDLEVFYISKLSLHIFVCVDMFVFQVGVASVNQLEVVIGPSMHISQIYGPPQTLVFGL